MGKSKRGFIDKKSSATFRLVYKEYDPTDPFNDNNTSGRVFTRVDGGGTHVSGFTDEDPQSSECNDSVFADADDEGGEEQREPRIPSRQKGVGGGTLPDHVRKEIIELGFPDDGYNYLFHLREIRSGGPSAFIPADRPNISKLPADVKAYDASKLAVQPCIDESSSSKDLYAVSSNTRFMRNVKKAVDPDVLAYLDKSDDSDLGTDVEDLEEDFVIQANQSEEAETSSSKATKNIQTSSIYVSEIFEDATSPKVQQKCSDVALNMQPSIDNNSIDSLEKDCRAPRFLDEQFELLTLREYGDDDILDDFDKYDHNAMGTKDFDAPEIGAAMEEFLTNNLDFQDKYTVPRDNQLPEALKNLKSNSNNKAENDSSDCVLEKPVADVISKCREYAENYANDSEEEKTVMLVEDSSDDSGAWDCETIVSTYSNLDNHPGKINAPSKPKNKAMSTAFQGESTTNPSTISLRGKQQLPLDYLPGRTSKKSSKGEKSKEKSSANKASVISQSRANETLEQKKARKAAIKEEKREARKSKKEFRELYKGVSQHAQHTVAVAGPPAIHLM